MNKFYFILSLVLAAVLTVSCRNVKRSSDNSADQEVVEAAKVVLADDVMAVIDELAARYAALSDFSIRNIFTDGLSEDDKLVKPEYLLEPSMAQYLMTRSQKVYALSTLIVELPIRRAYGMPVEPSEDAILQLAADVNYPIDFEDSENKPLSETVAEAYAKCKENNELDFFFQYCFSFVDASWFLLSQNPDAFFRNITEEQYANVLERFDVCMTAMTTLAEYDPETANFLSIFKSVSPDSINGKEDFYEYFGTLEAAKKSIVEMREVMETRHAKFLE